MGGLSKKFSQDPIYMMPYRFAQVLTYYLIFKSLNEGVKNTFQIFASVKQTLSELNFNINPTTINSILNSLKEKGLIRKQKEKNLNGSYLSDILGKEVVANLDFYQEGILKSVLHRCGTKQ